MDEEQSWKARQGYLDEFRTNVEPVHREASDLERMRQSLVVTGFRAAYGINAGGAIALPAFHEVLTLPTGDSLVNAVAWFVGGIIVTVIANFTGHYSADAMAGAKYHLTTVRAQEVSHIYYKKCNQHAQQHAQRKHDKLIKVGNVLHIVTAGLLVGATVCFCVGVWTVANGIVQ